MASFATYFVHDCLQLVKKRQVYLTELTTILCSIIQFFCKNKLKLFRICRGGGGGGLNSFFLEMCIVMHLFWLNSIFISVLHL